MNNKYLLSVTEASQKYGIGRDRLYQLIRSEADLPILKIGNIVKINSSMFEKWLDDCVNEGREL